MAFSESLKKEIRKKSFHLCCLCKSFSVDIHHLIPQSENGPDTEENAVPLCAKCHDLYGSNPIKRKQIKEARDSWFETCQEMYSIKAEKLFEDFVTKTEFDQLKVEIKELKEMNSAQPQFRKPVTTKTRSSFLLESKFHIKNKDYEKAKVSLIKEIGINLKSDEAWFLLGAVHSEDENIREMLKAFDESLSISKKYESQINDYKKYNWQTTFNKGVGFFNSAIKITQPSSMESLFEKAIEQFNNSIACEPNSSLGYENVAASYLNMGKTDESIPVLEKLISMGEPPFAFSRLGQIYLLKGANLIDSYDTSRDESDRTKAYEWYNKAVTVLEKGRAIFPSDADILLQLGNAYYSSDKLGVALESFKSLSEKNPADVQLKYAYGVVLLKSKKYDQAAQVLTDVVNMDANSLDANYNLAATYISWGNDLRETAINEESNDKTYLEKFKATIPYLQKYLEIKPDEARVWLSLGQVFANLGMKEKAEEAFKKVEEL